MFRGLMYSDHLFCMSRNRPLVPFMLFTFSKPKLLFLRCARGSADSQRRRGKKARIQSIFDVTKLKGSKTFDSRRVCRREANCLRYHLMESYIGAYAKTDIWDPVLQSTHPALIREYAG